MVVDATNLNIEKAIRLFRRRVESARILSELKRREYFVKPSEAARAKRRAAIKRARRKEKAAIHRENFISPVRRNN